MTEYKIKTFAVINIRDLDGVKNAINLMTTDGSRVFQCVSAAAKKEWIEKFEVSVKFNTTKHKKGPAPQPPKQIQRQQSSVEAKSISSNLTSPTNSVQENYAPDWVVYAPEEVQAEMAQRHFEESLALIQRVEDFLEKNANVHNGAEISEKVKALKLQLSSVLLQVGKLFASFLHSSSQKSIFLQFSKKKILKAQFYIISKKENFLEALGLVMQLAVTE